MRARKLALLRRRADILDVRKDPRLDADLEERRDQRADELHEERRTRGHLDVVPQLQVLNERRRLRERLYRVRLE